MTVFGWDASDFDWDRGPMDLGAAARDGVSFFTHKATEGTKVIHRYYGAAMGRARAAGIEFVGAYIVPRTPGNNGHGSVPDQVSFFLNYLDSQTPWWRGYAGFFLQVDSEHWGYDDVSGDVGAQACELLRAQTGKWVVHYAPNWAYGNTIPGNDPLWASSYGGNPAVPYRQAYPGDGSAGWNAYSGRTPTILQYGSATVIGSQSTCDANAFRGSIDEFRAMITGGQDVSQQAENILWAQAVGMPTFTGNDGKQYPFVGTAWEIARAKWQASVDAKLAAIQTAGMSDAQFAELKAAYLAKIPTAADMVDELVRRAKPAA